MRTAYMTADVNPSGKAHWQRPVDPDCTPETALQLLVDGTDAAGESLREVAQTLSHELRTPLTTIYSGSQLLSRYGGRLSDAMVREVSSAMAEDAERLLRIVEDLVVAAALPDEPATRGEPLLLQRTLSAAARAAENRWPGWSVSVAVPAWLPAVAADELHLEQVLRNILDNAAYFGPSQGTIAVRADVVGDRVEVHVLDRGPGVDPDDAERVFHLFARPGTADHQGGLGLGLFVSRRLVELMGGRMWVAPRAGGGSDFGFDLPIHPVDER
jgi:signal transduction histidine kinase